MRLGGTVAGAYSGPAQREALLVKSRFRAITAPFDCRSPRSDIDAFREICAAHDVVIVELGVWKNVFDPNPERSREALADEIGVACCVNIAGTSSAAGWDAADPDNFTPRAYERLVESIRDILDSVKPRRAFYCLEPMPWMVPDSPGEYLRLMRDVNRAQFAAHMDFVNMINCPRRSLAPEAFIEECFETLAPYIVSTHLKDTRMHPTRLTTVIEECAPGEGTLDFGRVLQIIDRHLTGDAPVLLEHMSTFEEYAAAYDYVRAEAERVGVGV